MYRSNVNSWKRCFPEGRVYPTVEVDAPPENEHSTIGAVRFRYPFKAPLKDHMRNVQRNWGHQWYLDNNKVFDLFFSIPAPILSDPKGKCRDLLIMFQGTNETRPWNAYLYDRLGESLAQRNIASILLPTPFHLNRAAQDKEASQNHEASWQSLTRNLVTPTNVAEPARPFANFYQTFLEVDKLCQLIRGGRRREDYWGLYERLFDKSTRVSLLGFSMGGLRALAKFLKDCEKAKGFHRCVLLSSGGTIASLKPPDVEDPDEWARYVKRVAAVTAEQLTESLGVNQALDAHVHMERVFFEDDPDLWAGILKDLAEKILVVLGTADITRGSAIRRMQHAELHTVAGMNHNLGEDIQFELRYPEIIDMLVKFLQPEHPTSKPSSRKDIRGQIYKKLVKEARVSVAEITDEPLGKIIMNVRDPTLREQLKRLYLQSKARFGTDADLVESMLRHHQRSTTT